MIRTSSSLFIPAFVFLSLLNAAFAANDWTKPCFEGVCSYDFPSTTGEPSSGSLKIWGSPNAIADITSAAGWEILGCDQDALSQDIRLACTGDHEGCAHLYNGDVTEGKVVRLPENCGPNPFAHISRAWVPEDQSIPQTVVRGDGSQPEVLALHIDSDFDSELASTVNFAFSGSKVPGRSLDDLYPSNINRRGLRSFFKNIKKTVQKGVDGIKDVAGKVGEKIKDSAENLGDFVKHGAETVKDTAENVGDKIKDTAGNVGDKVKDAAETVGDKVKDAAENVGDKTKDAAEKVGDKIKDAVENVGDKVKDAFDNVKPRAVEVGVSSDDYSLDKRRFLELLKKVTPGLKKVATNAFKNVKNVATNTANDVKNLVQPVKLVKA